MNSLGPGVEGPLDALREILPVVFAGGHVGHVAAVAVHDDLAVAVGLSLVPVLLAVVLAVEVILIPAPGHAGHDVDGVAAPPPGLDIAGQVVADAVDHGHVGVEVDPRVPRSAGLEAQTILGCSQVGGLIDAHVVDEVTLRKSAVVDALLPAPARRWPG